MSAKRKVEEKRIEVKHEILEIHLNPETIKRMDEVVNILGFESKEDLVRCTIRNMWTDIEWMDEVFNVRGPDRKIQSR